MTRRDLPGRVVWEARQSAASHLMRLLVVLLVASLAAEIAVAQQASSPGSADDPSAGPMAGTTQEGSAQANPSAEPALPEVARLDPKNPTLAAVAVKIEQLQANDSLPAEQKEKLLAEYQKARDQLQAAAEWQAKRQQYLEEIAEAPAEREDLEQKLAEPPAEPELPETNSLAKLREELQQAITDLAAAQAERTKWKNAPAERATRRVEIPEALGDARERLAVLDDQLKATPAADENGQTTTAVQTLLQATRLATQAEIAALEAEARRLEQTEKLVVRRQDWWSRQVERSETRVAQLRQRVGDLQSQQTQRSYSQESREADTAHPAVKPLAEANRELAARRTGDTGIPARIAATGEQLTRIEQTLEDVRESYESIKQREERLGLTDTISLLLRREQERLPDVSALRREIGQRRDAIAQAQVELIELYHDRSELADISDELKQWTEEFDQSLPDAELRTLKIDAEAKLKRQRELLESLISDYETYLTELVRLNVKAEELVGLVTEYQDYIAERILWVRSTEPLGLANLRPGWLALAWLMSWENWQQVVETLTADLANYPLLAIALAAVVVGLVILQRRLRQTLARYGQQASQKLLPSFWPTIAAVGLTLLIAVTWPALVWFVAWRLSEAPPEATFVRAVSQGLFTLAAVSLITEAFRQICRGRGLAECHFGVNRSDLLRLRRHIRWFMLVTLPLAFIVASIETHGDESFQNSLGRLAFIVLVLNGTVQAALLLNPRRGVIRDYLDDHQETWTYHLRYGWYGLAVAVPLGLAGAAAWGYYYTALQITDRLQATVWFALSLAVINAMLLRWLLITRRKLALEQVQQRRKQQQAEAAAASKATPGASVVKPPVIDEQLNLSDIDSQSRSLLTSMVFTALLIGGWIIWVDMLPALGILRQIELYPMPVEETLVVTDANGGQAPQTITTMRQITLADILLGVLVLGICLAAARNLPGLLEIAVLRRLPLDAGGRYAISTLSRYSLTILGVIVACSLVGFRWSSLQWLVAAVGVGLGFGLQEIFANFVSGVIILFERPIRVGDTVSVGDITGTVARIRIRATTIIGWDRRELVVPNREFVTGQVVNWTLSDTTSRIPITVGVAYGTDTERVRQILMEVAHNHPLVLKDPSPVAFFEGFGDSTLNFKMFIYVPSLSDILPTRDAINRAIDLKFREEKIEIAFPQRDLHIRTVHVAFPIQQTATGNGNGHPVPEPPTERELTTETEAGPHRAPNPTRAGTT